MRGPGHGKRYQLHRRGDLVLGPRGLGVFYGRNRGYVCLWDLRNITNEQLHVALDDYYFLNPRFANNSPIFLFISERLFPELIPWTKARDEGAKEVWVPHAEAWYPGNIPFDNVSHGIRVHVKRASSPLQDLLKKATAKRESGHR